MPLHAQSKIIADKYQLRRSGWKRFTVHVPKQIEKGPRHTRAKAPGESDCGTRENIINIYFEKNWASICQDIQNIYCLSNQLTP